MEEVQPTLVNLIELLKNHLPAEKPSSTPSLTPYLQANLSSSSPSQLTTNENSQVYERNKQLPNPIKDKPLHPDQLLPHSQRLFKEVLKLGKKNFSKVDVILLSAFILQNEQFDRPIKTKQLNSFLKDVQYQVSNLSHFVKLNVEYGKLCEENHTYFLTAQGDQHLENIFGAFIELASQKLKDA
jgi:hypothetical protein